MGIQERSILAYTMLLDTARSTTLVLDNRYLELKIWGGAIKTCGN
jgi:hypothetical protein